MPKIEMTFQDVTLLVSCAVLLLSIIQLVLQKRQADKDRLKCEPFFVSSSGRYGEEARVQFRNDGGAIRNVSVKTDGDSQVSFVPQESIPAGCEGIMIISKYDDSRGLRFRMTYKNAAGEECSKNFEFQDKKLREADDRARR